VVTMADPPLLCIDCPGPATVQVLSPEGLPVGTFCDEHWQAAQVFSAAVMAVLERAAGALLADG